MALDVLQFKTFADIPDAASMQRFQELASKAHRQLSLDGPASLSTEEWHCLRVMAPDKADEVHREQRKRQDTPPATQAKAHPSAPAVRLASFKEDDTLQTFFERCKSMATPMWLFSTIYEKTDTFLRSMNDKNVERNEKIAALEARVTAIEDRGLEYRGVFTPGEEYKRGDACTEDGSLWIARHKTTGRPGVDFDSWQLAVKKGKPGPAGPRGDR